MKKNINKINNMTNIYNKINKPKNNDSSNIKK